MNYPFWNIPYLGSGWMIGIIAIFHMMFALFAVGGGLFLPMAERKALRMAPGPLREGWLKQVAKHSKFFLTITGVYGTVSGVGIWFAIGLTHPEATSTLIHNFVFGWAIEWVFFIIELTSIAVYVYTWEKVDEKLHLAVGWVYAVSSALTLIIINGILTFMLTPGDTWLGVAGTGQEASKFWNAFFNPTYWPSLLLRCCVCASLAAIWALITSSQIDAEKQPALKTTFVRWSVKWLIPSFLLTPLIFVWYLWMVPASQQALLALGFDNVNPGLFSTVTRMSLVVIVASATILAVAYFLAYADPLEFKLSHALCLLLLGLIATGAGEYTREMLRKPYVIGRWMYSNGVRVPYVERINHEGYLAHSNWVWNGRTDLPYARGEAIFRGECGSCHTLDGYRPLKELLSGRDRANIRNFLTMLHNMPNGPNDKTPGKVESNYGKFMPPMSGTQQDIDDLADYLNAQVNPGSLQRAAK